ncbi:MAG: hypothetical protein K2X93_04820 [Candidatus Obscuribacterales bacterium]|nr:hypothetical protein [Candidatus Obscuribacterales bacterium]
MLKKSLILLTSSISFAVLASTFTTSTDKPNLKVIARGWEKDGFVIVIKPSLSIKKEGCLGF